MYDSQDKMIKIDNDEFWYVEFGRGTKPLVMIPGVNLAEVKGSAGKLSYFYRRFGKDFKAYIFDKRSTGYEGSTIRSIAEDTACAMKQLGIKNACVLGVSQGGMIAQQLAENHPELVERLVLGVTEGRICEQTEKVISRWIELAEQDNMPDLVKSTTELLYTDEQMKKYKLLMPIVMKLTKAKDTGRFIASCKAVLTCSEGWDDLGKIKCPTLAIAGEQDKIVPVKASKELAERLGCKLITMPNEGHAAYLSDEFNKMVYDFFMK